jgi:NAD(P)-dependent dehydrogenase (short-subunit alcohol dehydrogenase family)
VSGGRSLAGRNAVVTGSSRGIGRAVARALAGEGAGVVVNGRADADGRSRPAEDVVREIEAAGGQAIAVAGSVADFEFAGELIATCIDHFGSVDVLVNCAGVPEPDRSTILDITPEAWQELIGVHLSGTFHCCRHAAPAMVARGSGTIVNTSSHSALGLYGGSGYPAAKGGTNSLTLALAAELRGTGVRVNAVCPGARTRLNSGDAYVERIRDLHARGLLDETLRDASLDPPDPACVGAIYAFLAGPDSDGISGRIFSASGGYVGVFDPMRERLLAFRDPRRDGAWSPDALAAVLLASEGLGGEHSSK